MFCRLKKGLTLKIRTLCINCQLNKRSFNLLRVLINVKMSLAANRLTLNNALAVCEYDRHEIKVYTAPPCTHITLTFYTARRNDTQCTHRTIQPSVKHIRRARRRTAREARQHQSEL